MEIYEKNKTVVKRFTLTLGKDVSAEVLRPVRSAGRQLAQLVWIGSGQRADSQGERGQRKSSLHVCQLQNARRLTVQFQNLITCSQT